MHNCLFINYILLLERKNLLQKRIEVLPFLKLIKALELWFILLKKVKNFSKNIMGCIIKMPDNVYQEIE